MKPFLLALTVSVVVQLFKFATHWLVSGRPHFPRLVQMGGMPSSHSAAVAALSTAVYLEAGPASPVTGVTLFFSLLVMYDAAGVRRAAGRQAKILNRLLDEHQNRELRERRLLELLGHTPFEVVVGAVLGLTLTLAWYAR